MERGGESKGGIREDGRDRERLCNREERPRRRMDDGCVVKGRRRVRGGSERGSFMEGDIRCVAMGGN